jgi:hypothetical protein
LACEKNECFQEGKDMTERTKISNKINKNKTRMRQELLTTKKKHKERMNERMCLLPKSNSIRKRNK